MASQPTHTFTFEEYLDLERKADRKNEFQKGKIYAMSGGTYVHSALAARITRIFAANLPECWTFDSNLRIYVKQFDSGVYPDCSVLCGQPEFWNDQKDVIVNPSLVVEVLSPSPAKYDRGDKSAYYRSIKSVQHILLISQDQVSVEHSVRESQSWKVNQYAAWNDTV